MLRHRDQLWRPSIFCIGTLFQQGLIPVAGLYEPTRAAECRKHWEKVAPDIYHRNRIGSCRNING